jgi:hypothetical protein
MIDRKVEQQLEKQLHTRETLQRERGMAALACNPGQIGLASNPWETRNKWNRKEALEGGERDCQLESDFLSRYLIPHGLLKAMMTLSQGNESTVLKVTPRRIREVEFSEGVPLLVKTKDLVVVSLELNEEVLASAGGDISLGLKYVESKRSEVIGASLVAINGKQVDSDQQIATLLQPNKEVNITEDRVRRVGLSKDWLKDMGAQTTGAIIHSDEIGVVAPTVDSCKHHLRLQTFREGQQVLLLLHPSRPYTCKGVNR